MSEIVSAMLPNPHGCVTRHVAVRLEIWGSGQETGMYVIFECTESKVERVFGVLSMRTNPGDRQELYPDVPVVDMRASDDEAG